MFLEVTVSEKDNVGDNLVCEIKEAIKGPQSFRLVESDAWPYIRYSIVTLAAAAARRVESGESPEDAVVDAMLRQPSLSKQSDLDPLSPARRGKARSSGSTIAPKATPLSVRHLNTSVCILFLSPRLSKRSCFAFPFGRLASCSGRLKAVPPYPPRGFVRAIRGKVPCPPSALERNSRVRSCFSVELTSIATNAVGSCIWLRRPEPRIAGPAKC